MVGLMVNERRQIEQNRKLWYRLRRRNIVGGQMVTWTAILRLPGGQNVQVQVRAPTQHAATQLIQMQYSEAELISGPHRLDLMRAI